MGISQSVALWLRELGHDAAHLNDENLYKLPDTAILKKAVDEKRIILTLDLDFGHLLMLEKISQTSVIQFRISSFKPLVIREKLELILNKFPDHQHNHFIITVEDNRIRLRNLPV